MNSISVADLVERFRRQHAAYRSADYNEYRLRQDFLDPLFALLGWDMENRSGQAEHMRDVVHEDRLRIEGRQKAPDYSFRVDGRRRFFVEAKKPAVDLREDWEPAYQLRRYGWTAGLPVSLLTDFEEFVIYDCRRMPKKLERTGVGRLDYFRFDELPERWNSFTELFHREAVASGSLERYAGTLESRRGVEKFDAAFLADIENWRAMLAADLCRRNPALDAQTLTATVQRLIDRILFLRFCEDRGIEQFESLREIARQSGVYPHLCDLFRAADRRYNSGLFHFSEERGRAGVPDLPDLNLQVGDEPLQAIISRLYYPESPYAFAVISADVLGQIYERFLGKVVTIDPHRRVTVEEKPEVRKAGGVFYTPTWVVDRITTDTVGRAFDEHVAAYPDQPDRWCPRVCDIAAGSGSFLLGAYDLLLRRHLDLYTQMVEDEKSDGESRKDLTASKETYLVISQAKPSQAKPSQAKPSQYVNGQMEVMRSRSMSVGASCWRRSMV